MNLMTLWINRGETDLELMQALIDSIYTIDPGAVIGDSYRHYQKKRSKLKMYIQATEEAVAYVYTGLFNAGGVYVDKGVGNGLVPIEKWTPKGANIKPRARYLYRPSIEELSVLTPNTASTIKRRGLGGFRWKHANASGEFRHPDPRTDQSRSLREISNDSDIHNEQGV